MTKHNLMLCISTGDRMSSICPMFLTSSCEIHISSPVSFSPTDCVYILQHDATVIFWFQEISCNLSTLVLVLPMQIRIVPFF